MPGVVKGCEEVRAGLTDIMTLSRDNKGSEGMSHLAVGGGVFQVEGKQAPRP